MFFSGWPFKKRNKDADKSDHLPVQPVLTLDQKYSSGVLQVTDLEFDFDKIDYKRQVGMIRQALDNSLLQGYPDDEVLRVLVVKTALVIKQTDNRELPRKSSCFFQVEEQLCLSLLLMVEERQDLCNSWEVATLRYQFAILLHRLLKPQEARALLARQLDMYKQLPDSQRKNCPGISDMYSLLGKVAEDDKNFILARQYYQMALDGMSAPEHETGCTVFLRARLVTQLLNCRENILDPIVVSSEERTAIERDCVYLDLSCYSELEIHEAEMANIYRVFARILQQEGNVEQAEYYYSRAFYFYNQVISDIVLCVKFHYRADKWVNIRNKKLNIAGFHRNGIYFPGFESVTFRQGIALPSYALALLEYTLFSENMHEPHIMADLWEIAIAALVIVRYSRVHISRPPVCQQLPFMLQKLFVVYQQLGDCDKAMEALKDRVNCCYCGYEEQDWLVIQNYLQASLDLARYCAFEYIKGYEARRNCSQIICFCQEINMRLAEQIRHRIPCRREYIRYKHFQLCQKYLLLTYYNSAANDILYKMDEKYIARV
jgi:hypothetical protein